MEINSNEIVLIGNYIYHDGGISLDGTSERINHLIKYYFIKITTDKSGWNTLYQDPNDKRYWELIYSHSEIHGGGLPSLLQISVKFAKEKYNV